MPTYKNTYKPVNQPEVGDVMSITPEEYDFNFVFPVQVLRTDRIELRPFVPSLHAQILYDLFMKYPETQEWLPMETKTLKDTLESTETRRRQPGFLQYAVYTDKPGSDTPRTDPSEYEFAGTVSIINASADDLVAELGWIIIFPPFQKTHVLTHAAGAMMHHILDMPEQGGLGLRRCQWFTTSLNLASQKAALRLGFTHEGILRNHRVIPHGKNGAQEGRPGDSKPGQMSRDSWLASMTWREWEESLRDKVDTMMARR